MGFPSAAHGYLIQINFGAAFANANKANDRSTRAAGSGVSPIRQQGEHKKDDVGCNAPQTRQRMVFRISAAQQRQTSLAMYPPRNSQRRVGNPMALSVLHRGEFRANFR